MPKLQILPLIDSGEGKQYSFARVVLVEPLDTNDPLPVWIPSILHFSSCCNSDRKGVVLAINPRLRSYFSILKTNSLEVVQCTTPSTAENWVKNAKNCVCFIDNVNLLLKLSDTFLSTVELISKNNNVIFVFCLDSGMSPADSHSVEILRSLAQVRLNFKLLQASPTDSKQTWHLEVVTVSPTSARFSRKTHRVSSNMVGIELVKQPQSTDLSGSANSKADVDAEGLADSLFKLPFSLSLTTAEEASRRNVVLPHSQMVGRHEVPVQEINVFKDEDDEYTRMKNELDPDDDLDI